MNRPSPARFDPTRPWRSLTGYSQSIFFKPGWAGRLITVIDDMVKKKHFCFINYIEIKINSFRGIVSLKIRTWPWKQALDCKLVPLLSASLAIISEKGKTCFSHKFQTLKNRLKPNPSKSLNWGPSCQYFKTGKKTPSTKKEVCRAQEMRNCYRKGNVYSAYRRVSKFHL